MSVPEEKRDWGYTHFPAAQTRGLSPHLGFGTKGAEQSAVQAEKCDPSSAQSPHALWCGTQVSLYLCKASTGLARSPRPCLTARFGRWGQGGCSLPGGVCTPILPPGWRSPARLPDRACAAAVACEAAAGWVLHVPACQGSEYKVWMGQEPLLCSHSRGCPLPQ